MCDQSMQSLFHCYTLYIDDSCWYSDLLQYIEFVERCNPAQLGIAAGALVAATAYARKCYQECEVLLPKEAT